MWLLAPLSAWAGPTLRGDPVDVALAGTAWSAAEACTGRPGRAHATVEIRRDFGEPGAIGAVALWDKDGLHTIRLSPDAPATLLAHEVGHAWFGGDGPLGTIEGRTEVLAECIAARERATIRYLYDPDDALDGLTDLLAWTAASQKAMTPAQVRSTYQGSLRFFLALREVIPASELYRDGQMSWDDLRARLRSDPRGAPLLAALDGGPAAQRAALTDTDRDGLAAVVEQIRGTDPARWDTDGDGWWDGAPTERPAGVLPVPGDGTPVCPTKLPASGTASFKLGGNLRGFGLDDRQQQLSGEDVMLWIPLAVAQHPGGYWYEIVGDDLRDNPTCRVTARFTLHGPGVDGTLLDGLAAAIDQALDGASSLGPPQHRLVVKIESTGLRRGEAKGVQIVTVGKAELTWAAKSPERMQALGRAVVAAQRLLDVGKFQGAAYVRALVRHLYGGDVPDKLLWVQDVEVDAVSDEVAGCGGWLPYLGDACPR